MSSHLSRLFHCRTSCVFWVDCGRVICCFSVASCFAFGCMSGVTCAAGVLVSLPALMDIFTFLQPCLRPPSTFSKSLTCPCVSEKLCKISVEMMEEKVCSHCQWLIFVDWKIYGCFQNKNELIDILYNIPITFCRELKCRLCHRHPPFTFVLTMLRRNANVSHHCLMFSGCSHVHVFKDGGMFEEAKRGREEQKFVTIRNL